MERKEREGTMRERRKKAKSEKRRKCLRKKGADKTSETFNIAIIYNRRLASIPKASIYKQSLKKYDSEQKSNTG